MNLWWMLLAVVYFNGSAWAFIDMLTQMRTVEFRRQSRAFILTRSKQVNTFGAVVTLTVVTAFWPIYLFFVIKAIRCTS